MPLVSRHLPLGGDGVDCNGRLHSWHPKRVLKEHLRACRGRHDGDNGRAAREASNLHWQARFRDCYLKFCLVDGANPKRAPLVTKLVPISDDAALDRLLLGHGSQGYDSVCLGTFVPAQSVDESLSVDKMLPERLEAMVWVLDWSGPVRRQAQIACSKKYEHFGTMVWGIRLGPDEGDSIRVHEGGCVSYSFDLNLFVRKIVKGQEEKPALDDVDHEEVDDLYLSEMEEV